MAHGIRTVGDWVEPYLAQSVSVLLKLRTLKWGGPWHFSKGISLFLLISALIGIIWLHNEDTCFIYREDVTFTNISYLNQDELYQASLVDGWSTFWLRPSVVEQALQRHPYVADAEISIQLPAQLTIQITEQEPTALWVTDAGTLWLLEDGTALAARHNRSHDTLRILDGEGAAQAVSFTPMVAINAEVMRNAQKLASYFPSLQSIMFHEGIGLNFSSPNSGIWVYWGDGTYFETKLKNLLTIENELTLGRLTAELVDLRLPDKPIIR